MSDQLRDIGEFGFIERMTRALPSHPSVLRHFGDDCAVVRVGETTLLVTCDAAVEEVHFSFKTASAEDIGWRTATAAISDIGAMGGRPLFLTVAVGLPKDMPIARAEGLSAGIAAAATAHEAIIIGGDTTTSPGGAFIDVTVIGSAPERPVLRNGAREGDLLAVTGFPGRSAAGLLALQQGHDAPELIEAHLRPRARIQEGQWLAMHSEVHAMIDVSDGLVQDAGHITKESGVGADINPKQLPLSPTLSEYSARVNRDALEFVLAGGEDYELAVALDPDRAEAICTAFSERFGLPLTVVGRFTSDQGSVMVDGQVRTVGGYAHFA